MARVGTLTFPYSLIVKVARGPQAMRNRRLSYVFSHKCSVQGRDLTTMHLPGTAFAGASALTTVHFRPDAVHRLLARLDASKATGPDGISARVLKECARELVKPHCQFFALCFQHGVQSQMWKTASVVPIHKRSARSALRNYRPVSLLSIISKMMESVTS